MFIILRRRLRKLLKLKLVEIVAVKNKKDLWYLHTKIIPDEMLDKELSYKIKYSSEPLVTTAKEKLEKKSKIIIFQLS